MADDEFTAAEVAKYRELELERKRLFSATWTFSGVPTDVRHHLFLQKEESQRKAAENTPRGVSPDFQAAKSSQGGLPGQKSNQTPSSSDESAISRRSTTISIADSLFGAGNQAISRIQEVVIYAPRTAQWNAVIATLDTGATENWISQRIVDRCRLAIESGRSVQFLQFEGKTFESDKTVRATWRGQLGRKTQVAVFRVADKGSPFDVLFGWTFLSNEDCENFCPEPADPALVLVQSQVAEKERLTIEQGKADAEAKAAELEKKRMQKKHQQQGSSSSERSNAGARQSGGHAPRY